MKSSHLILLALSASGLAFAQQAPSDSLNAMGPATPAGQTAAPPPLSNFVVLPPQRCPVALSAKQTAATELVKVQSGQDPHPPLDKPGQRIRLSLTRMPKAGKVTATVTVRGLSARGRVDNATAGDTPDLRRTMNVTFDREDDKTVSAELVLPGFTAVKSVKLEALQFEDGSTRDFAGKSVCTVTPDPLMLVAGR